MRWLIACVALLLGLSGVLAHTDSKVVQLTSDNFHSLTQLHDATNGDWLIKFYAPWCGHCKRLAPIFEELATVVDSHVHIAEIDVESHTDIKELFGVTGYPTLLFFKQAQMYHYKGERTVDGFQAFLRGGYTALDAKPVPKKRDPNAPTFVIELTADNFDTKTQATTGTNGDWLVKFYAPWCGHCKQLAPTYEALSQDVHGRVNIAEVDVTAHEALGERFGIQGFPTMLFFSGGKMYDYSGARNLDSLTSFVLGGFRDKEGDAVPSADGTLAEGDSAIVTLTTKTFDNLVLTPSSGGWFIKFMAPWCGHCKKLARTWEKLAQNLKEDANVHIAKVDATVEDDLKLRFQVAGYPTLLFIKDNKMYKYSGARTLDALTSFATGGYSEVEAEELPTSPIVDLNDDNFDAITRVHESGAEPWLIQFYAHWCSHCKDMAGAMLQTALDVKGKVNVGRVDAYVNTKLGARFGVTGYPWLVLLHQGRLYEFDGIRDPKLMTAFALEEFATKDSRAIPSPPVEEVDTTTESSEIPEHVTKLTTPDLKTLNKAFVMIHAPWCSHCNKLLPTFGKAATQLLGQVTFGSIDGTDPVNQPIMTAFDIKSYPTVMMLHDNSYTLYEGDRSLNSLVSFASSGYLDAKDKTQLMPTITPAKTSKDTKKEDTVEMAKNVHVVEWTADTFDDFMQSPAESTPGLFLVEFYAQWCGPCRAFSSLYEEIASELKKSSDIIVARIDGSLEEELRTRMNILNYPTIMLVDKKNGQYYKFSSKERTKDAIMAFVNDGYKEVTGIPVPPPPSSTLSFIFAAIIIGGIGWSIGHFKNGKKRVKSLPKKPKKKVA